MAMTVRHDDRGAVVVCTCRDTTRVADTLALSHRQWHTASRENRAKEKVQASE